MLSMSPVAHSLVYKRAAPRIRVLDVREDVTDLTTYTFTACNIDLGGTGSETGDVYGTNPHVRVNSKAAIIVLVHAEDAATTFSVNSVTIGGVSGVEQQDRGGGTNAINSATYSWNTAALFGITTTDIVVTFSEAVTGCAIGVLLVENIGLHIRMHGGGNTGTAAFNVSTTASPDEPYYFQLVATTQSAGSGAETALFENCFNNSINFPPMLLYEASNAEFAYAAAWTYTAHYCPAGQDRMRVDWSGTSAFDASFTGWY